MLYSLPTIIFVIVLITTFGVRRSPFTNAMEFHPGIDLAAPLGSEVHAPADGVVAYSGRYPIGANPVWWRYGTMVILRHGAEFVTVASFASRFE